MRENERQRKFNPFLLRMTDLAKYFLLSEVRREATDEREKAIAINGRYIFKINV